MTNATKWTERLTLSSELSLAASTTARITKPIKSKTMMMKMIRTGISRTLTLHQPFSPSAHWQ